MIGNITAYKSKCSLIKKVTHVHNYLSMPIAIGSTREKCLFVSVYTKPLSIPLSTVQVIYDDYRANCTIN